MKRALIDHNMSDAHLICKTCGGNCILRTSITIVEGGKKQKADEMLTDRPALCTNCMDIREYEEFSDEQMRGVLLRVIKEMEDEKD